MRSRDGKVVLVKWFDNRSVVLASNFVGVGDEDEVERWEQKEGRLAKIKGPDVVKKYSIQVQIARLFRKNVCLL